MRARHLDYLQTRKDVDHRRCGDDGLWSPRRLLRARAAAFEKRFKLCVAWGANHNWGEPSMPAASPAKATGRCRTTVGTTSCGGVGRADSLGSVMASALQNLAGRRRREHPRAVPDHARRQRPANTARRTRHQSYNEALNSRFANWKIFTDREGGVEHVSADNMEPVRSTIAVTGSRTDLPRWGRALERSRLESFPIRRACCQKSSTWTTSRAPRTSR